MIKFKSRTSLKSIKSTKNVSKSISIKRWSKFALISKFPRVRGLRAGSKEWSLFCSFSSISLNELSTVVWRLSNSLTRPHSCKASL